MFHVIIEQSLTISVNSIPNDEPMLSFMSYMLVSYKTFTSYMCKQQPLRLTFTIFYDGLNPRTNID
jgi:hypothetical protein